MRCSGPRGPGGVGLRRPPPPNPRGPGASEPPAGLGAAKLERPTCPAPVRCPNPPEARKARSSGAPQPLPFALPRPPLCPHAKPSTFLREQTSHRQAHRQTHRHSHAPTPRETAGLRKLLSQSQSAWERRGQDERAGGWLSGDTEAEIHEDSETDSKTARGDTHHTHTPPTRRALHTTPTHTERCPLPGCLSRPLSLPTRTHRRTPHAHTHAAHTRPRGTYTQQTHTTHKPPPPTPTHSHGHTHHPRTTT